MSSTANTPQKPQKSRSDAADMGADASHIESPQQRCAWCAGIPEFAHYHDHEWGFPVVDDIRLFEKISLEGFQAGLSWRTILNKRARLRTVFAGFDFEQIARFGEADVARLLEDKGIVRHAGKIRAVLHNAARAMVLREEFGSLAAYFWRYEVRMDAAAQRAYQPQQQTTCAEAIALSQDLKKRGWKFVGPTTMYAFMQAMGLINDHERGCATRLKVTQARAKLPSVLEQLA